MLKPDTNFSDANLLFFLHKIRHTQGNNRLALGNSEHILGWFRMFFLLSDLSNLSLLVYQLASTIGETCH